MKFLMSRLKDGTPPSWMINPTLVGSGKRLFRGDNDRKMLRLADSTISSTGVVIATYDTADD
jgi:hypothetical protein